MDGSNFYIMHQEAQHRREAIIREAQEIRLAKEALKGRKPARRFNIIAMVRTWAQSISSAAPAPAEPVDYVRSITDTQEFSISAR